MLKDDGDIVKAMGYVALYSSYLEEQIENLIVLLTPIKQYEKGQQVSDRIKHAKKTLRLLDEIKFSDLIIDLTTCSELFRDRNKYMHRQVYAGLGRPDSLKSTDSSVPDESIDSSQLYKLANEFRSFRLAVYRPMIFDVRNSISDF